MMHEKYNLRCTPTVPQVLCEHQDQVPQKRFQRPMHLRVILTPTQIPMLYHVTSGPFPFPKLSQEDIWALLVQISDALKLDSPPRRAGVRHAIEVTSGPGAVEGDSVPPFPG